MKSNFIVSVLVFILSGIILFFERIFYSNSLLYEQILLATLMGILLSSMIFRVLSKIKKSPTNSSLTMPYILVGALLFYSFGFSVIMTVDRSKSLYVLNWVHQLQPVTVKELQVALEGKYNSYDKSYIEQRISEQVRRGVFEEANGAIAVSRIGSFYWSTANLIAKALNLKGWFASRF